MISLSSSFVHKWLQTASWSRLGIKHPNIVSLVVTAGRSAHSAHILWTEGTPCCLLLSVLILTTVAGDQGGQRQMPGNSAQGLSCLWRHLQDVAKGSKY